MPEPVSGLHHVTGVSGAAQENLDFYTGLLGLRLVKLTVNFDDPALPHLYYGNAKGEPGTILTFFPAEGAGPGRPGAGQAAAVALSLPPGSLAARARALAAEGIPVAEDVRFGAPLLRLTDPHGLPLELIEAEGEAGEGAAVSGLHSVTLWLREFGPTLRILTEVLGYAELAHERRGGEERLRLRAPAGGRGALLDLCRRDGAPEGRSGAGALHHVAFRARDLAHQDALGEALRARGLAVSPRRDRRYFHSIYVREPGGVLLEIATDAPGFAVDEAPGALGRSLRLPPEHEPRRPEIERRMPRLRLPAA